MALRLSDTMSRQLIEVVPLEPDHVRLYTCGPTVYARAHIGNFRTFIFEDILRRWLERRFERVTHVMNLTDVEDKIIRNATLHHHGLESETAPWIEGFFEDLGSLGIRRAHHYPRATEYIAEMVAIIRRLEARGLTYESDGSIYFRISGFEQYGRLSGARSEGLVAGASGRVDADEYSKEDARDFALWKSVAPEEIGWDTELGRGRPGWHIECSAMSMSLLGESFDIHCGGIDNIFPHHENEIAQSEGATGKRFVSIWVHSAHLRIGGEKMAKSAGNFSTLHDIVSSGVSTAALRYLLAADTHYSKTVNYSEEPLHAAGEAAKRWVEFRDRMATQGRDDSAADGDASRTVIEAADGADAGFAEAMDDDLNVPKAMGIVFTAVRSINRQLDSAAVTAAAATRLRDFVESVDDVLGILPLADRERAGNPDSVVEDLLAERQQARQTKDWSRSDQLRDQLAERGVVVEDTAQGQRWRRG